MHPRNRLSFLFPSQCHQQLYGFPEHSLYSMQYWGISVTLYKGPYSLASQECIYRSSTKVYVDVCPVADWSHPFPDWFQCDHHCCQVNHPLAVAYHGIPWTLQNMGVMTTSSNGNLFHVTDPLWGETLVTGGFPSQRSVTRSLDIFFDFRLNKQSKKQSRGWWFETPSRSIWRHRNVKTKLFSISLTEIGNENHIQFNGSNITCIIGILGQD